jgi:carboxyl-terminal processing protease
MNPRSRLFIALVSTGLVAYVALGSLLGRVQGDSTYGQLALFNEVVHQVRDSYVEPVDLDRTLASAEAGLTEALDGDSAYLDDESFRAWQQPPAHDAEIGVTLTRRFAFLMVVAARPGSPAERAGLRTGDIIKTVDGRHSRTIPAPVGERLLRGAPGSVVKLGIMRSRAEATEVSVVRERPQPVPPEARRLEQGPGYLRIREFAPRTADDVRARLESLVREGAPSLVLDLRDNATGQAEEAIKVAELFVPSGVLGRLSGRKVPEQVFKADPARQAWTLPVVALVDNGTAGPAEILAAALADAERAKLVGQHTFGRAGVQKALPLPQGGLVLTVAKYLTPKGESIHGKGLEPSEVVTLPRPDDDTLDEGETPPAPQPAAPDAVLERALELLKATAEKKAA